ncbi:hypothetical protein N7457_003370 [Penicillium paradoxum]|uniref:uncharacterized protein n=1 Tax=Penicillium paradoxum TaxID=176176 RepID=UPI002549A42E|nr:uncharacterized protein N7457_003370 [Penicillium paradoxum]KAJ5788380.1 hypothetical protein N7457_003370 [Penicillium paradoxum]
MCPTHLVDTSSTGSVCEKCNKSNEIWFKIPEALKPDVEAALELEGEDLHEALRRIRFQTGDMFIIEMGGYD